MVRFTTHTQNVIGSTQRDPEFMRFLKELGLRNKFFKNTLESESGKREEPIREYKKCDYILTAFLWYGNWNKINDIWKIYIGATNSAKRRIIKTVKNEIQLL